MKAMVAKNGRRRIDSFTGWRGLAVIFVMLYHWFPNTVAGGYLGVVIFLLLSGYLVTDQFLREARSTGTIQVLPFYQRRLKRLYPPLIFFLLVLSAWILLFQRDVLVNYRGGWLSTLLGVNNWWQIFREFSYFDQYTQTAVFTHLWTLGIELQFYLVWPWVIFGIVKLFGNKRIRQYTALAAGVLSLLSVFLMAGFYLATQEVSRVYYGTDTRLFAFTLGALLAAFFPRNRLCSLAEHIPTRIQAGIVGGTSFLLLLFLFLLPGQSAFTYVLGMFLFCLVFLVHLTCVASPVSLAGRILANPVLLFIGERSYSLYLWQFAIQALTLKTFQNNPLPMVASVLLQIVFLLILTELTYRLAEQRGMQWVNRIVQTLRHPRETRSIRGWIALGVLICFSITSVLALILAPSGNTEEVREMKERLEQNESLVQDVQKEPKIQPTKAGGKPSPVQPSPSVPKITQANGVIQQLPQLALNDAELHLASRLKIAFIGDSILQMSADTVKQYFPLALIDANKSRQFSNGMEILEKLQSQGKLPREVVYALGTNGVLSAAMLDELATKYPSTQFYLLSIVTNQNWESSINALLEEGVKRHKNLHLIDWHDFAKGRENFFYEDGTHPNITGTPFYGQYLAKKILDLHKQSAVVQPVASKQN